LKGSNNEQEISNVEGTTLLTELRL